MDMRTKNFLKHHFLGALVMTTSIVVGQSTTPGNVMNLSTDYLGWDNTFPTNDFPLVVKHELNQPIEWWTDDILRMRLHPTQTTNLPLIGGGTIPVQQDGFLAISGTPALLAPGGRGAFTRLHLADIDPSSSANFYAQPWGYRGWMRNGMTLTGNRDQAYVGQLYHDEDESDMVIQWSDNSDKQPTIGPDRMRFLFTWNRVQGITEGAQSEEGLELM